MTSSQTTPATGELEEFIDHDPALARANDVVQAAAARDLLLFEYDGALYGVDASSVVVVVPWKLPAPVPGVDARVRGVIQDRGRIVVVLSHPTGRSDGSAAREPTRIIVCSSPRGYIGLPAMVTRSVGSVPLQSEPSSFSVYDSELGPFTYLEPNHHAARPVPE